MTTYYRVKVRFLSRLFTRIPEPIAWALLWFAGGVFLVCAVLWFATPHRYL